MKNYRAGQNVKLKFTVIFFICLLLFYLYSSYPPSHFQDEDSFLMNLRSDSNPTVKAQCF